MRVDYFEPATVEEARDTLGRGHGQYRALAGGTDVILQLRRRVKHYTGLVNIKRIPGLAAWSIDPQQGLRIGAATLLRQLETSSEVLSTFPSLFDAVRVIGSIQLRNLATVGGNLCNASPAADTAPSLFVLGATATFVDNGSSPRTVLVEKFFTGPGKSILGPDGLLLHVDIPAPTGLTGDSFERLSPRNAMDIGIVTVASRVTLNRNSGRIDDVAIALGAVAPVPVRAFKAEDVLRGHEPTPALINQAAQVAMTECRPINDIRGSAAYRGLMVAALVRRTVVAALHRARARA
jgi:carbon-monoxide dehydrogenase medium subunit